MVRSDSYRQHGKSNPSCVSRIPQPLYNSINAPFTLAPLPYTPYRSCFTQEKCSATLSGVELNERRLFGQHKDRHVPPSNVLRSRHSTPVGRKIASCKAQIASNLNALLSLLTQRVIIILHCKCIEGVRSEPLNRSSICRSVLCHRSLLRVGDRLQRSSIASSVPLKDNTPPPIRALPTVGHASSTWCSTRCAPVLVSTASSSRKTTKKTSRSVFW